MTDTKYLEAYRSALGLARKAVASERLVENLPDPSDVAYNDAIDHCLEAIDGLLEDVQMLVEIRGGS